MTVVEIALDEGITGADADAVRQSVAQLPAFIHQPVSRARVAVRRIGSAPVKRGYVADANVIVNGRLIAAHAAGMTGLEAVDAARDRLRRQVRRVADKDRHRRNGRRPDEALPVDLAHRPEAAVKPPSQRRIMRRRTYLSVPLGTLEAIDDLLSMDLEFMLFVHARTREDVTVHLQNDGRFGLLFPEPSPLADEGDIVVPTPSRYPAPLALSAARIEMDFLDHRFLYFLDAEDKRGKVIYLRHDGDYGLVEPA
jgi:ribosome-associated translation inhibitor RaiA